MLANQIWPTTLSVAFVFRFTRFWPKKHRELPFLAIAPKLTTLMFPCPRSRLKNWSRRIRPSRRVSAGSFCTLRLNLVFTRGIPLDFRDDVRVEELYTVNRHWVSPKFIGLLYTSSFPFFVYFVYLFFEMIPFSDSTFVLELFFWCVCITRASPPFLGHLVLWAWNWHFKIILRIQHIPPSSKKSSENII